MRNIIRYTLFIFTLILFGAGTVYAQNQLSKKGNKSFKQMRYVDAQKVYLKVIEKGYASEEIYTKLGDSYYLNSEYAEALKWYGELFDNFPEPQSVWTYLRYSQVLKANGREDEAKHYYDTFLEKTGRKERQGMSADDYFKLIEENDDRYEFGPVEALYDEEEISFGHAVYEGNLYYSSTYDKPNSFLNTKDAWTDLSFITLFKVGVDSTNRITGNPRLVKGALKDRFHDASPAFTKDGNTVYFTSNNLSSGKDEEGQILKIYRSTKKNGKWQKPEDLNINDNNYSTAHPTLSSDEKKLYFASDRPGGYGQSDLYVVRINADKSLGMIENLGPEINTSGRETFPFVTENNELYFSSDGHFGLGGLDVFYVKIEKDNKYGSILNVGRPINSNADDFSFGINDETKYGFVSSNRSPVDTVFVRDNIYSFKEIKPIKDVYKADLEGYVTNKKTGDSIEAASVTLLDDNMAVYKELLTDEKGHYQTTINKFEEYTVRASKEEYEPDEKLTEPRLDHQRVDLQLNPLEIDEGVDLADLLNIPIIHFDFDKSNIRPDAEVELQKVIALLEEYDELRINIRSHTDSRGSDAYNQKLSERRAKSTYDYLVDKGIDSSRLQYEGLGESEPVNECTNGVDCSEEKHEENRRSEFIVLE